MKNGGESHSAETWRSLFGLQRQLDPVALIALGLGVVNGSCQLVSIVVGSQVALLEPEQVEVRRWGRHAIVHAPMSYYNSGGHNGLVTSEMVVLEVPAGDINSKSTKLHWQWFIRVDYERDAIVNEADAMPFVVAANDGVSHQTAFYPRTKPCLDCTQKERYEDYLLWKDLVEAARTADRLNVTFTVDHADGGTLVAKCYIPLDENGREYMKRNGILTRTCVAVNE